MRKFRKYGGARGAPNDEYCGALHAGLVGLYSRKHTPAPTHKHSHARTRTNTHKILLAFPRQQWFLERASLLRYTNTASLVMYCT